MTAEAHWADWIGRTDVQHDALTPALLRRFNATLDRPADRPRGPQGIHWVLCPPEAATSELGPDGHPGRHEDGRGFLPPVTLPRRMWASSRLRFHQPIEAGAEVERQSRIESVRPKSGASGPLVFVEVAHSIRADGQLAVDELQTIVYREATTGEIAAEPARTTPDLSAWHFHRTIVPGETLLFRYSALTFNTHRIHYDLHYARDVERYRGLVVHGPLIATLLLDLVDRELGGDALSELSFRAQAPAFAGETLTLAARRDGNLLDLAAIGADGTTRMAAQARIR